MLYFITSNKNKFEEASLIIPNLKQLNIDLPEIQEIQAQKIIEKKLQEALKLYKNKSEFIVEDTSLYLDCLNGLPGPLIKWFLQSIGNNGLYTITEKFGNNKATAKTIIGYAKNVKEIYFFEGTISGTIVKPRGDKNFGWDSIFLPNHTNKTFAEMNLAEKNNFSMRKIAFNQLKKVLIQQN
jgi:non-canonical purine NTP pyrophosphatase (RdgB/HAM1 family)